MAVVDKAQLQDFERQLDVALAALRSQQWSSTSALALASEIYEIGAFSKGPDGAEWIERGYAILASHTVAGADGYRADIPEKPTCGE